MLNGKIGFRDSTVAGFIIRYTVNSATAAREVHFVVRYDGKNLPLVDRGTFAPHTPIKREFDKYTPAYAGDAAECRVTSVTFADGSRWDAPEPPAAPANR